MAGALQWATPPRTCASPKRDPKSRPGRALPERSEPSRPTSLLKHTTPTPVPVRAKEDAMPPLAPQTREAKPRTEDEKVVDQATHAHKAHGNTTWTQYD